MEMHAPLTAGEAGLTRCAGVLITAAERVQCNRQVLVKRLSAIGIPHDRLVQITLLAERTQLCCGALAIGLVQ